MRDKFTRAFVFGFLFLLTFSLVSASLFSDNYYIIKKYENASNGSSVNMSGYDSYKGATDDVDIGSNNLYGHDFYASGIGVRTTSPSSSVHIHDSSSEQLRLTRASTTAGTTAGILFGVTTSPDIANKGGMFFERTGSYGVGKLHLANNKALDRTSATITNSQITLDGTNVGINQKNPLYPLHSTGEAHFENDRTAIWSAVNNDNNWPPGLITIRARGTVSSPSGVQTGDYIGGIASRGYTSDGGFTGSSSGVFNFVAEENFESTKQGTGFIIETTPAGTNTRIESLKITGDGKLYVNGDTYIDGGIYANDFITNSKQGVTVSGTTCTITEITSGIITGAVCS